MIFFHYLDENSKRQQYDKTFFNHLTTHVVRTKLFDKLTTAGKETCKITSLKLQYMPLILLVTPKKLFLMQFEGFYSH